MALGGIGYHYASSDISFNRPYPMANRDLILRIRPSENDSGPRIIMAPTESIARPIHNLLVENAILKDVVKNLWKVYKYDQEYQAFLLGGSSEEEFLAIAEQFAAAFDDIPEGQLVYASSFLLNVLDEPLTSSELSVLMHADPSDIEKALSSASSIQRIKA